MNEAQVAAIIRGMAPSIQEYVKTCVANALADYEAKQTFHISSAVASLSDATKLQIAALESRKPDKGDQGPRGKSAYELAQDSGYSGTLAEWLDSLKGIDGDDGSHGTSVSVDEVRAMIVGEVANIPRPKDGEDGDDGKSVTLDDVKPLIEAAVAAIPVPKDGEDGDDGDDGKSVTLDEVRPIFEAAFATWALECERRYSDQFQRWLGTIPTPKDGEDGIDGVGFDDFDISYDGERTIVVRIKDKTKVIRLTHPIYREVWDDEKPYEQGDTVTLGGSMFIATKDFPQGRPGVPGSDWQLCVKHGRDLRGNDR